MRCMKLTPKGEKDGLGKAGDVASEAVVSKHGVEFLKLHEYVTFEDVIPEPEHSTVVAPPADGMVRKKTK